MKIKMIKSRTKHGMYGTPTYRSWLSMKHRCSHKEKLAYRNVSVCDEWSSFDRFYADMGIRPEGKTLDRIDPYGNYSKSNCRWADNSLQNHNQRNRKSETGVRNVYKSGVSTYRVRVAKNGTTFNFGTFNSLAEAKIKDESVNYADL